MVIRMELLSDAIWGTGESIPGAEDTTIVCDEYGFPYLNGSTFYGILKEEMCNYFCWTGIKEDEQKALIQQLFEGKDENEIITGEKIIVSNFIMPKKVKDDVKENIVKLNLTEDKNNQDIMIYKQDILDSVTYIRNFTSVEDGVAKEGSHRKNRCIKKGMVFYGTIDCKKENEKMVEDVLPFIKHIGSVKTRGFGKIKLTVA